MRSGSERPASSCCLPVRICGNRGCKSPDLNASVFHKESPLKQIVRLFSAGRRLSFHRVVAGVGFAILACLVIHSAKVSAENGPSKSGANWVDYGGGEDRKAQVVGDPAAQGYYVSHRRNGV